MYNIRSSSSSSHGNQYITRIETFRQTQYQLQQLHLQQQQQQTMSNVKNCITPKITTPMKNQIQKHAMPLHDAPSQSTCPKSVVQTQILRASITQISPVNDFENKQIKLEDERSISEKSEVYSIQKINKEERKNHLNAQMRRLVSHKNPLMIISELFNDVPIQLQEHSINNNVTGYTATLEIDGQMYTANHISKIQAKQKACENFLRIMLAKKIKIKEESHMQIEIEDGENGTVQKPKDVHVGDSPLLLFASLAMYNLMDQWKLQHVSKAINLQEEQPNVIKSPRKVKANAMRKFPEDPKNYNPIRLLNQMKPGVIFIETFISSKTPSVFQVKCEIDNIPFTGQGLKKKAAKMECCIAAIKYFWQFDFHAEVDLHDLQYKITANAMRKFPEDPKNYNPVQLLNQMKPGVIFIETFISSKMPSVFQVKCEIDNIPFTGQGLKKKAAKMECCIAAIKYFWQFDFHVEVDLHDLQYKITTNAMRKFPEVPKNYNPVQLLNQMKPGVIFIETFISSKTPSVFQVKCEIDNIPFTGQGLKKKAAKMECCIAAIKYFWQFDFHA